MSDEAYVSLVTTEDSVFGILTLGHSLRKVSTTKRLVAMVTPNIISVMRDRISQVFDEVICVDPIYTTSIADLSIKDHPDLTVSFTKINCWKLTQYKKCVFLDPATLVLQNVDELFEREELSAAPDIGWPDCFNSGVFVYRPSMDTFNALLDLALTGGGPESCSGRSGASFDGGDQGLLNHYFMGWATKDLSRHLPFVYNLVSQAFYSYAPAMKRYGGGAKIIHFGGFNKPWHHRLELTANQITTLGDGEAQTPPIVGSEYYRAWWVVYVECVKPMLCAPSLEQIFLDHEPPSSEADILRPPTRYGGMGGATSRREDWERGNIDYLGVDKFENIQALLDEQLSPTNHKSALNGSDINSTNHAEPVINS